MLQQYLFSQNLVPSLSKVELFPVMVGELLCCYTASWNKQIGLRPVWLAKRAEFCMQIFTVWCVFVGNMFYCVGSCRWVFLMVKICLLDLFCGDFLLCAMVNHHFAPPFGSGLFNFFPSIKQANPWFLLQLFERGEIGEIGTRTSEGPKSSRNNLHKLRLKNRGVLNDIIDPLSLNESC